ncbi:MAG TPA: hypothetical protein VK028_16655 [Micromonosporaceae bacterium]|nr:hypothetical protein [Micromonosporaceae bacterium]
MTDGGVTGSERDEREPLQPIGTPAGTSAEDELADEPDFAEEHDSVTLAGEGGPERERNSDQPEGFAGLEDS